MQRLQYPEQRLAHSTEPRLQELWNLRAASEALLTFPACPSRVAPILDVCFSTTKPEALRGSPPSVSLHTPFLSPQDSREPGGLSTPHPHPLASTPLFDQELARGL